MFIRYQSINTYVYSPLETEVAFDGYLAYFDNEQNIDEKLNYMYEILICGKSAILKFSLNVKYD